MIRETLERIAPFVAALAALAVFSALCVATLRGFPMQVAACVVGAFAAAFFIAITCDRRIHRVLTSAAGDWEKMRAQAQNFRGAESTTLLLLRVILFAEVLLAFFALGLDQATTIVAIAGFAVATMISICEYVRRNAIADQIGREI